MKHKYITFNGKCPSRNICENNARCTHGDFDSEHPSNIVHPYIPLYITNFNGTGYHVCEPTEIETAETKEK